MLVKVGAFDCPSRVRIGNVSCATWGGGDSEGCRWGDEPASAEFHPESLTPEVARLCFFLLFFVCLVVGGRCCCSPVAFRN